MIIQECRGGSIIVLEYEMLVVVISKAFAAKIVIYRSCIEQFQSPRPKGGFVEFRRD